MNRRFAEASSENGPAGSSSSTVAIRRWLEARDLRPAEVHRLAGDVSTRSYSRVRLEDETRTWIVARYPPELAAAQRRFATAGELLATAGVRVPSLRLDDPEAGFALVEDLGPETLFETIDGWQGAPQELAAALSAARIIAGLDASRVTALGNPALGAELLRRELAKTWDLLRATAGFEAPELVAALDVLCVRIAGTLVPCHRDFMVRNLMPATASGEVGVLDHQDLRLGPIGYDLASLLNDSLFADESTEARALAASRGWAGTPEQYRAVVVQRALKAVGSYLSFALSGQRRHLPLVVPTLERALRFLPQIEETAGLAAETSRRLMRAGATAALC